MKGPRRVCSAVLLFAGSVAFAGAKDECRVVARWGQGGTMVSMYCPAKVPSTEIAKHLLATKDQFISPATANQVHFFVYNDLKKAPKSNADVDALSDAQFDRLNTLQGHFNKNTGHSSFMCHRSPKSELTDCPELLK